MASITPNRLNMLQITGMRKNKVKKCILTNTKRTQ